MTLSEQAKDVIMGYLGKGGRLMLDLVRELPKDREYTELEILELFFKELEKVRNNL